MSVFLLHLLSSFLPSFLPFFLPSFLPILTLLLTSSYNPIRYQIPDSWSSTRGTVSMALWNRGEGIQFFDEQKAEPNPASLETDPAKFLLVEHLAIAYYLNKVRALNKLGV